jgi:aryl-alcohol dehydrogenase-like predicted oxidoreductase
MAPVQNLDRLTAVTRIAERHGGTAYQVALAWLLDGPNDAADPRHQLGPTPEENVAAAGLRLDRQEIAALNDLG